MNSKEAFPPITVVVSVYNKVGIVEKCIQSILEIDYPRWETLIIEGYSTDGSYEIVKKYHNKLRILRVKGNYATALNRAFSEVKTPLVAVTDADCTVDKNWLRELAGGFSEGEDIVATAGYVGTGEGLPLLATLIGIELQERYRYFPKYLSRAPTMNLCVRKDIAKEVKFNERLQVAIETDFGYRLTKKGNMLYVPEAIVYHHPRTTWMSFFRQQVGFASGAFWVYLRHKREIKGDHISTFSMIWQIPLFCAAVVLLLFAVVSRYFLCVSLFFFFLLLVIYLRDTMRLPIKRKHYPMMVVIFAVRTVGWATGALKSLSSLMAKTINEILQ